MFTTLYAFVTSSAGLAWLGACALKAGLLLAAAGLGATLVRRGTAAARHLIWTLGITAALLLPVLSLAAPALMGTPVPTTMTLPAIAPTTLTASESVDAPSVVAAGAPADAPTPSWPLWLAALWAAGSLVVVIRLVRGQLAMPTRGGTFDVAAVTAEVEDHLGELQQCYARRLAVTPTLAGQILIHGAIAPSGDVADVCITQDTVGDRELAACVNQLIKARHFAPPRGGSVDVQFPLTFVRAGA